MAARNIGELVVPCQSDVTVVCPEGGQRGPEGARGGVAGTVGFVTFYHSSKDGCEHFHNYHEE